MSTVARLGVSWSLRGLRTEFPAMRCHSHAVETTDLPAELVATAVATDDREPMAFEHTTLPVAGVQFHPESIATPGGRAARRRRTQRSRPVLPARVGFRARPAPPLRAGPTTYLATDVVGRVRRDTRLSTMVLSTFPRGVVVGAVGMYRPATRRLVSNTIITCAQQHGDQVVLRRDGGLTIESDVDQELAELDLKIRFLV